MKLYKYGRFDLRLQRVLLTKEAWYSFRKTLNDPFDCMPELVFDVSESELNEIMVYVDIADGSQLTLDQKKEVLKSSFHEKDLDASGVYCLSEDPINELMWAHYADNHRGLAIGWEVDDNIPRSEDFYHMWPQKVNYTGRGIFRVSDLLVFQRHAHGVRSVPDVLLPKSVTDSIENMIAASHLQKNPVWHYEKEVRFIKKGGYGYSPFDASVESITYGLRFDTDSRKQVQIALSDQVVEYQIHLESASLVRKPMEV